MHFASRRFTAISIRRRWLWAEFTLLFVGIPGGLAVWHAQADLPFFPVLLAMFALTVWIGRNDPNVSFGPPPDRPSLGKSLGRLAPRLLLVATALAALTGGLFPELFFRFPRESPRVWVLVMLLYPLLSVLPQEVMFRAFFMPRYAPLFGRGAALLAVNALAFAWAHVFFLNWIAPLLSLAGGWLLADTWQRTRDLRLVCIEHALYGQLVFTTGIGWFFYTGSTRAIEQLAP